MLIGKKKILFLVLLLLIVSHFTFVIYASAHTWTLGGGPIVPCGTTANPTPCTRCDLFHLLKHLIDFGLFLIVPVGGTLLFITAGIFYILGAGNPAFLSRAKNLFTQTLYGIIVIALAWLITNTILGNLGTGGPWGTFVCVNPVIPTPVPVPSQTPPTVPPTPSVTPPSCDPATVAKQFGTRFPRGNSTELDRVIACVTADPAVAAVLDRSQIYTYLNDPSKQLCNFTHGRALPQCGVGGYPYCVHVPNSCHFGGATGKNGAEGVDFNAIGNTALNEDKLYTALRLTQPKCGFKQVEQHACPGPKCHSHMSARTCDGF